MQWGSNSLYCEVDVKKEIASSPKRDEAIFLSETFTQLKSIKSSPGL